ncbi:MAG: pseudouridine synthase [Thiothrix sp.]|nr:pseudouridine synthase [Thiothrix sp.]HPQ93999.1 pseudouridine synthase [Thiolinea sp.]
MRLDQFVSQSTGMSRRQAGACIRAGQVFIGDTVAGRAGQHVSAEERISLGGELLAPPGPVYIMLYKPAGVVSATMDVSERTVLDLIDHPCRVQLHVAGRLDKDTTGLLLLSNDGDWTHRLTSPRHHVGKTYRVTLAAPLGEQEAQQLCTGLVLNGALHPTLPAQLVRVSERQVCLTIYEGKYHQVKRMFAAVGNRVLALHREQLGCWVLDPALQPGEWKFFSP